MKKKKDRNTINELYDLGNKIPFPWYSFQRYYDKTATLIILSLQFIHYD